MNFETLEPKKSSSMFFFFFFPTQLPLSVISCKSMADIRVPSLHILCDLCAHSLQQCPTLWDPLDCGSHSSVHGLLNAGINGVGCHALLQRIFSFDKCIMAYIHHYSKIQNSYTALKAPHPVPIHPSFSTPLKKKRVHFSMQRYPNLRAKDKPLNQIFCVVMVSKEWKG